MPGRRGAGGLCGVVRRDRTGSVRLGALRTEGARGGRARPPRSTPARVARGLAGLATIWVASACSVVVDPIDGEIACVPGTPDPCAPLGLACVGMPGNEHCRSVTAMDAGPLPDTGPRPDATCVRVDGAVERCDGVDDDCDGVIDNGHDSDGDGVTWCGEGVAAQRDCDDANPSVHPAFPPRVPTAGAEICDGVDNDCDGTVDPPSVCPAGQVCLPGLGCLLPEDCRLPTTTRPCVSGESCNDSTTPATCRSDGCGAGTCPGPMVCDLGSGDCVVPAANGSPCERDAQCGSQLCAPVDALALPPGASPPGARLCVESCCTDAQCGSQEICWATGRGAKLCIPQGLLGLTRGTGGPGATCSVGSECASGQCFTSGSCLNNCAAHGDCGSDRSCNELRYDRDGQASFTQLMCVGGSSGGGAGDYCLSSSHCRYSWCWLEDIPGSCGGPCATSADCPGSFYCGISGTTGPGGRIDAYRECRPMPHSGRATSGTACNGPHECRDYACVGGTCADACCDDAQCPGGRRCRLQALGTGRYGTFCLPAVSG